VAVGTSQALLTFTTNGPAPHNCKVPNVLGLGLAAAKTSLLKANCALGHVRRAYSRTFRIGHVLAEAPRRGTVLAPHAPVDLTLSRGPRP
jgi:beta-lactam-binding protein with PASTA domain